MNANLSTLCYLEKNGKYLMLHRTRKKNDVNKDKWIGVGGHFEQDESPEECVAREVREETGLTLTSMHFRGLVTFVSGNGVTEYMSLFTADNFTGMMTDCDEGELEWIDKKDIPKLNLWAGDRIFFRLLEENLPFFSLKLVYDGNDRLISAVLNGHPMELFALIDPSGHRTGEIQERGVVHSEGLLHMTVHIWIIRTHNGVPEVLLQKRSPEKDSFPGCYDISSAGHITASDSVLSAAIRELKEELGITASACDLKKIGEHHISFSRTFHGKCFRDQEIAQVFVYRKPVETASLSLQPEEVTEVHWFPVEEVKKRASADPAFSVSAEEFRIVTDYLEQQKNS